MHVFPVHSACLMAAIAALSGAETPAVSVAIADGNLLAGHLSESPLGALWIDPGAAGLRAAAGRVVPTGDGDLLGFLARTGRSRIVLGVADPPIVAWSIEAGTQTPQILARWAMSRGRTTTVPGADAAIALTGTPWIAAAWESILTGTTAAIDPRPLLDAAPSPEAGTDIAVRVDPTALANALTGAGCAIDPSLVAWAEGLRGFGPATAAIRCDATGLHEVAGGTLKRPVPGLRPVDRALITRLPATTLAVAAVGCDGPGWWAANRRALFAAAVAAERMRQPEAIIEDDLGEVLLDGHLASLGIGVNAGEIIRSLDGTILVAVTSGLPFPALTVALPAGPGTDAVARALAASAAGGAVPEPGVPLALQGRASGVSLLRAPGQWILSTDAAVATALAGTAPGGCADTPVGAALAAAAPQAVLIGASDTPAVLRLLSGVLTLATIPGIGITPAQQAQLAAALDKAAAGAGIGRCALVVGPDSWSWTADGLIAAVSLVAAAAPLVWATDPPKTPPRDEPSPGVDL
jgi:hypothetical protein